MTGVQTCALPIYGILVRRSFRLLNAKGMGLTITLADITGEEFRTLELIEAIRQEISAGETTGAEISKVPRQVNGST